jgi:hypothetical protein
LESKDAQNLKKQKGVERVKAEKIKKPGNVTVNRA